MLLVLRAAAAAQSQSSAWPVQGTIHLFEIKVAFQVQRSWIHVDDRNNTLQLPDEAKNTIPMESRLAHCEMAMMNGGYQPQAVLAALAE
jgi:hypothetical protein